MREILTAMTKRNSGSLCGEEWVETPSFIFKDSRWQGVGVESMQRLYLVSASLFIHAEKDGCAFAVADLNSG